MTCQFHHLKSKRRVCLHKLNEQLRWDEAYLAVFNNFCRGTCRLVAQHGPVGDYLSFPGESDYLFLAVYAGFEDLDDS